MRRWRKCWAAGGTMIALLAAAKVEARGQPLLDWTAPSGCPARQDVEAKLRALLGREPENGGGTLSFRAVVSSKGDRFELDVSIQSASGAERKTIEGASCDVVADAYVLVVAFALDPALAGAPSTPTAPSSGPKDVAAPLVAPPAAEASGPPNQATSWAVGALAVSGVGSQPSPSLGAGALVAVGDRPRWELSASYLPERGVTFPSSRGEGRIGVRLISARPSVCFPLFRRSPLDGCIAADVGRMDAKSTGVTLEDAGASWWLALSAGVAAHISLTERVDVRLRIDVGAPLLRPNFVVSHSPSGLRDEWKPAQVFGLLVIEPELRLFTTDRKRSGDVK